MRKRPTIPAMVIATIIIIVSLVFIGLAKADDDVNMEKFNGKYSEIIDSLAAPSCQFSIDSTEITATAAEINTVADGITATAGNIRRLSTPLLPIMPN